jgi:hypothetical protein
MFLMLIVTTGTFRQPRTRPADKVNLIAPFAYRDPRGGTLAINALPSRVRSAETRRLHSSGGRRRIRLECGRCYHASAIRQSRAIGGKQPVSEHCRSPRLEMLWLSWLVGIVRLRFRSYQ